MSGHRVLRHDQPVKTLFLFQLVAPLVLIAWMGLAPSRAWVAFWLQVVATATALWTMALLGIWLMPPWWAPHAFGVALAGMVALGLRRRLPFASALPVTRSAWLSAGISLVLGGASAYGLVGALHSRAALPLAVVNLSFPLGSGSYLVVNGGSNINTNAHLMTLDAGVPRFREWRGQSYGVDIVKLDAFGLRARGVLPADPKAYAIYGAPVLAPCAGRVVLAVDGLPDLPVPEMDRMHMAGNHVLLRCAEADVLLGHMSPGSVQVRAGDVVVTGLWLGSVGNSGNTGEPHLHVHAQRPGPAGVPIGGDPLPIMFNGHFPVRGDRIRSP